MMSEELTARKKLKQNDVPSPSTSDEESSSEKEAFTPLDWRMDAEDSLSDWTIEISVGGHIHGTYHVHRTHLAVGSRSEYFTRLFAIQGHKEHATSTSRIEMEELAAEAFPLMLDYLYNLWNTNKKDEKPITAENAVALHYFGRYFGIPGLRKEARSFWKKNMTIGQVATYLEHAKLFQDDQAYDAVVKKCVSSIHSITVDSRLMQLSDVQFWLDVLERNGGEPDPALSSLVSSFCMKNKEVLGVETFLKLTEKTLLPELSAAAAMDLMQLEKVYAPTSGASSELSDLQSRGIEALLSHRKETDARVARGRFNDLPPLVVLQLMERSIDTLWDCNKKLDDCNEALEVTTRSCVPKEIVVSGAAIDAVNGTYCRASKLRERAPSFVMDGTWEGSPVKFELYLRRPSINNDGELRSYWYISTLTGTKPDYNFYRCNPAANDSSLLPPKQDWRGSFGNGKWVPPARPPSLAFNFDELPSDRDNWFL